MICFPIGDDVAKGSSELGQAVLARGMDLLYSYLRVSVIIIRMWRLPSRSSQVEIAKRVHR